VFLCRSSALNPLYVRDAFLEPHKRQKIWKPSLLICIYCNPLKTHKTAKTFFGKAWQEIALIWKGLEKAWSAGQSLLSAQSFAFLSRSALAMTLTDESAIAAAAITGDSVRPKKGYSTPAAIGTPAALYRNAKTRF
jgi:hypothetical protein